MAKAKPKAIDVVTRVVSVLEPLDAQERARVIRAALTLLGEETVLDVPRPPGTPASGVPATPRAQTDEKAYFDLKQPNSKIEELAVAARFREERENASSNTRADLERVVRAARRNFDRHNFHRDLTNARRAGLFARGTARDTVELSHYGQSYVDALPDRQAVKALRRPRSPRRAVEKKKTARAR